MWWYLVDFCWKRGQRVTKNPELGIDLIATGEDDIPVSLKQLRCDEVSEMLGVWLIPNRIEKRTIEYLRNEALDWARKMRLGYSSPEETWTALYTNIRAKLKYPLPACTST